MKKRKSPLSDKERKRIKWKEIENGLIKDEDKDNHLLLHFGWADI